MVRRHRFGRYLGDRYLVARAVVCASLLAVTLGCSASPSDDAADVSDASDVSDAADQSIVEGACALASDVAADDVPDSLRDVACTADFNALGSLPLDATVPGARSVKVILDTYDALGDGGLYFQNSQRFLVHYAFVSTHLSGDPHQLVQPLESFNTTEYFSPDRRFVLGAVTHYEDADVWALEVAPYDTASAAMLTQLFDAVSAHAFFGPGLRFHPTSGNVQVEADKLTGISLVTTDEIYAGTDYQPLSFGTGIGQLVFVRAEDIETTDLSHETIVVLDQAPNDLSVVQGMISEEFQTPLSHLNVLAQNRNTPNMGLRGAFDNAELRALEGQLVALTVAADGYTIRAASLEEATAAWEASRPEPVVLPALDLVTTAIIDIEDVTPEPVGDDSLRDAIKAAVNAYGGKAAQYSILARTDDVVVRQAFAVPVYYYDQFMKDNGIYDMVDALLLDEAFVSDATVRAAALTDVRTAIMAGSFDVVFEDALREKMLADYPGKSMRFRTSTNSEDLEGFPCAGCYESHTGDPTDWEDVRSAIKETYASTWLFRTFEERSYYGVDHKSVAMALLVHPNFPDEEANGVAVTNNPYDASGLDPAFFINVQTGGDAEVVHPPQGVSSDQLLYWYYQPNQPTAYLSHSSLVAEGATVLTAAQIHELGTALDAIHRRFSAAYGPGSGNTGWYAMDVEFKLEDEDSTDGQPHIIIKQARPYPGRGD